MEIVEYVVYDILYYRRIGIVALFELYSKN